MALDAEERRQICRQNARRSTGPKTVAGKIKSSSNATKHGLSVKTLRLFRGDSRELQEELDSWMEFYKPTGPDERALVERAVVALIQKQRCIAAARRHVLESGESAAEALALYRRYEQMHRQEFHRASAALLARRAESAIAAPDAGCPGAADLSDDIARGLGQFGYY
jgi:hypothetical protein